MHILSDGIRLDRTRLVTVEDCDWKFPQFKGGGCNGYLFGVQGNDNLFERCRAAGGRHNFSFGTMSSNGNVLHDFMFKDGRLSSDFHMFLSMANLLDGVTCDGDCIEAQYRPYGGKPIHGVTATESVFWNTRGVKYVPDTSEYAGKTYPRKQVLIISKQFGNGYVIGTQGPASQVSTTNYVEGIGKGASLSPTSLYADQLARRLHR